jgi:hypothetical protein
VEDLRINGSIILKRILKKSVGDRDWIELAQDMDRWRDFVTVVMNLPFPQNAGYFLH